MGLTLTPENEWERHSGQRREQKQRGEVKCESWARKRRGGGRRNSIQKTQGGQRETVSMAVGSQVAGGWEDTGAWGQIHIALTIRISALGGGGFACFAMMTANLFLSTASSQIVSAFWNLHITRLCKILSCTTCYSISSHWKGNRTRASKAWGNPHDATLTHFLDLFLNVLTKNIKMQGTKEPSPLGDTCICYDHYSYIHFIQSLSSSFMLGNVLEYKVSGFKLLSKLLIK